MSQSFALSRASAMLERYQIGLYIASIVIGLITSRWISSVPVTPALAVLLFATFLALPLRRISIDLRLGAVVSLVNFVFVPAVVFVLTLPIRDEPVIVAGVVLVLLAPCVDYVVAFSGLAGASHKKLMALTPLLLVGQIIIIPVLFPLLAGRDITANMPAAPLLEAFVVLIVIPVAVAGIIQLLASRPSAFFHRGARTVLGAGEFIMVPAVCATLFAITATYGNVVAANVEHIIAALIIFVAFVPIMIAIAAVVSRQGRLSGPDGVSVIFSGVTRNSLVILPFALALPAAYELVPVIVVGQTLVELCAMVAMMKMGPVLHKLVA